MSTVRLTPKAVAELRRRYQVLAAAEAELKLYLGGILDGLGIDRETFRSFDDELGCIDLVDPEPDPATSEAP